jgi:AraC-like DNA-binding protein
MANRFLDIRLSAADPALADLLDSLREDGDDLETAAERINACLRGLLRTRHESEKTIEATHRSLLSEETTTVASLIEVTGMNPRTFERFCKRHFGFPASTLLKKQRFLRSLGKYMLDPSMAWIDALDTHYWDQAHFIRDFRATMNMTPGEYARLEHPIVEAAVAVTNAGSGVPHQALHRPAPAIEGETGV